MQENMTCLAKGTSPKFDKETGLRGVKKGLQEVRMSQMVLLYY